MHRKPGTRLIPLVALLLTLASCGDGTAPIAVGTLERDRLDLVAEAFEPVIARPVEEGAYVEAGTLLVELDSTRVAADVAQAIGVRDRTQARLAELVRGPRSERIAEARARLKGADGRLTTSHNDFKRATELFEQGVISQGVLDQRRALFDEAAAARDEARASLDEALDGTTAEELAQAEAELEQADAALANARVRMKRLSVRAPMAGWLDALPYELGEQPPVGGVVAVLLADRVPYARAYVPAAIRVHVEQGTLARVRVDGIAEPFRGRVRVVATEASFTPYFALTERDRGRLVYLAKVDLLDEHARKLPSGVPVEVEFEQGGATPEVGDGSGAD